MAFDYAADRDSWVYDLIADAGMEMTLSRITGSVYDASTGVNTPTTATSTLRGVVADYTDRDIDGTLIRTGDRKVIAEAKSAAAEGITPSENDTLTFGGVEHQVVRITPKAPAGIAITYEIQVRTP